MIKVTIRIVACLIGMCAVVLALAGNAKAGELVLHGPSRHSDGNKDQVTTDSWQQDGVTYTKTTTNHHYNNMNLGVGYRTDAGWNYGIYQNSFYHPSAYVAKDWMFSRYAGVFLGLATGYDKVDHLPVMPIGVAVLRAPIGDKASVWLMVTPKFGNTSAAAHTVFSYKIN